MATLPRPGWMTPNRDRGVKPVFPPIPPEIERALARGRKVMIRDAYKRRLCAMFTRGDNFSFETLKGGLSSLPTVTNPDGSGKPRHRMRNAFNHIGPLVEDKVSAATSRIPSYEVVATTSDPEDRVAADVSQRVALYVYDKARLRKVRMKVVKAAIAHGGDGFAMPYFEPNVGPYARDPETGRMVGSGEVRVMTFTGNEVYWEPGVDFDDSRWWATEQAVPIDQVKQIPGFIGGELVADGAASFLQTDAHVQSDNLVMVTNFYERPCPEYPRGRRLQMANEGIIVDARLIEDPADAQPEIPEDPLEAARDAMQREAARAQAPLWEDYPLVGHDGETIDEPLIHRLYYKVDPDPKVRDLGLVWDLIDPQRSIDDCVNKLLEWKNRCLNPQMTAQINSLLAGVTPNDEPGFVYWTKPGTPPPSHMQAPPIPQELFQLYTTLREMMQFFASYADAQAAPDVAAKSLQQAAQQQQARWESFLGDLAEFDSRLMRHLLVLVARFYTKPRIMQVNGWFGPDTIEDFTGSQLMGQLDVTVLPGSLTQLSRGEMLNRIQFIVQNFPGFLSPEMALAALDGGAAMSLVRGYELDVAKVDRVIRAIRDGSVMTAFGVRQEIDPATGQTLMMPNPEYPVSQPVADPAAPPEPGSGLTAVAAPPLDPVTGQPIAESIPAEVPGYMPLRNVDNLTVWRQHLGDWCKTPDFERATPQQQDVAKQILAYIDVLEAEQAAKQAAQMQAQAAQMGMDNAQRPAGPKSLPSTPDAATP